jgi:hypothetical protein
MMTSTSKPLVKASWTVSPMRSSTPWSAPVADALARLVSLEVVLQGHEEEL